ncbi:MAG: NFACT RNA binding domain-containing protein, partial [Candidatus Gastranaerophilales bacterium]|nr:NFACT RNA binding domain-containing protein [Candidatus Gastranaerophilales bacterium]
IIFSLQNASGLSELIEIEDEISLLDTNGSNPKKGDKKTEVQHIFYNDVEILLGKNNKQNDFLIKKLSSPEDIWLHAAFAPSSHVIIKTQNGRVQIQDDVLLYAAKIVKENSPYKGLNKAQIIYTKRKFIKRPPDTPLGYVTYRGEKEITV